MRELLVELASYSSHDFGLCHVLSPVFQRYDYDYALKIFEQSCRDEGGDQGAIFRQDLGRTIAGLTAWDRFEHRSAFGHLLLSRMVSDRYLYPLSILASLKKDQASHLQVTDLLNNAMRCSCRGQFADALVRLYRAAELLGQIEIFRLVSCRFAKGEDEYGLTVCVEPLLFEQLPSNLQQDYRRFVRDNGAVILGLQETYVFLEKVEHPLGLLFRERLSMLKPCFELRNHSVLGHGVLPVRRREWLQVQPTLTDFIVEGLALVGPPLTLPQLPGTLEELFW